MKSKNKEPEHLRKGKEFHKKIQERWKKDAEGNIMVEKSITKLNGRKGRMDVFVASDEKLVAIAEIKSSDWDKMTISNIRKNIRYQIRQVWDYIESHTEVGKDVSPGVIFPKHPKDADRVNLIEQLFEEEGISIVWEDESIAERKTRS